MDLYSIKIDMATLVSFPLMKEQTPAWCLIAVNHHIDLYVHIKDPLTYVKYLEDNNLLACEILRDNQGYREFLIKYRSKEVICPIN